MSDDKIEIKCPKCGNTDMMQMQYIQIYPERSNIRELRKDNTLILEQAEIDYDGGPLSDNLLCVAQQGWTKGYALCLEKFPLPDGLEIDWN